jgi:hypothetical protein
MKPVARMIDTWATVIQVQSQLSEIQNQQMNSLIDRTHKAVESRSETNLWKGYGNVVVGIVAGMTGMAAPYAQGYEATLKAVSQMLPQTLTPILNAHCDSKMAPLSTEEQLNTGTRLPGNVEKGRSVGEARKELGQNVTQLLQIQNQAMQKASSRN